MHRIDSNGSMSGRFIDNPRGDRPATTLAADWLNSVQEEIVTVIQAAGLHLKKDSQTQLLEAIERIARRVALKVRAEDREEPYHKTAGRRP